MFFNYVSWLSPRYRGGFLGASSSRGLHHLAQRCHTQRSGHVRCRCCRAIGHQAVTTGGRRGQRGVSLRLATSFPLGPYFLHVNLLGLSSSGHVGSAHVMGDKEVFPYHQKAFIVGHVALSEAAYSRPSLYVHMRPNEGTLTKAGPTKRHV